MSESKDKTKKILMVAGGGCLALVAFCCISSAGGYLFRQSSVASTGQEHVERFLGHVQARDWAASFADSEYRLDSIYGGGTGDAGGHQRCLEDTALGDMTSFECHDAEVEEPFGGRVLVHCAVTSASRGEGEVTITANSADDDDVYLGFYWFASPSQFGPLWSSDECTLWSGREYFQPPPEDRVRPGGL
jgi:hypothetical protein